MGVSSKFTMGVPPTITPVAISGLKDRRIERILPTEAIKRLSRSDKKWKSIDSVLRRIPSNVWKICRLLRVLLHRRRWTCWKWGRWREAAPPQGGAKTRGTTASKNPFLLLSFRTKVDANRRWDRAENPTPRLLTNIWDKRIPPNERVEPPTSSQSRRPTRTKFLQELKSLLRFSSQIFVVVVGRRLEFP